MNTPDEVLMWPVIGNIVRLHMFNCYCRHYYPVYDNLFILEPLHISKFQPMNTRDEFRLKAEVMGHIFGFITIIFYFQFFISDI